MFVVASYMYVLYGDNLPPRVGHEPNRLMRLQSVEALFHPASHSDHFPNTYGEQTAEEGEDARNREGPPCPSPGIKPLSARSD
jgi:hypothetical protein